MVIAFVDVVPFSDSRTLDRDFDFDSGRICEPLKSSEKICKDRSLVRHFNRMRPVSRDNADYEDV
jgi:hypothetical protein